MVGSVIANPLLSPLSALGYFDTLCSHSRSYCQVLLDDRYGHDVEDAAGVGVFRVRKLFVAPAVIVGRLDVLVHLAAIWTFEIEPIFAMRFDGAADRRVGDLLFCDLPDVERLLVCDVELGFYLRDHALHGYLRWWRTRALLPFAGLEFHRAPAFVAPCGLAAVSGADARDAGGDLLFPGHV